MPDAIGEIQIELWVAAAILVGWAVLQAVLYFLLAVKFNKRHGLLTRQEFKTAVRTGFVAVIGPAFNTIIYAISMLTFFGSAITFMRLGVVGSPMWEYGAAQRAATIQGITLGVSVLSTTDLIYLLFGMTVTSLPFFLSTPLVLTTADKAVYAASKGKKSPIPSIVSGMGIGMMWYIYLGYFSTAAAISAFIASFVVSSAVTGIAKRKKIHWLHSWNLLFSLIAGMSTGYGVSQIFAA